MNARREQAYERGVEAEKQAAQFLQLKGYEVLERRYKTPHGEIDLIARKKDMLVFAEVKAHKTEDASLYAVSARTRRRIEKAALHYISMHEEVAALSMRFDVLLAAQKTPRLLKGFGVRHLDNAWLAGE